MQQIAADGHETFLCHRVRRSFPERGKILTRIGNIMEIKLLWNRFGAKNDSTSTHVVRLWQAVLEEMKSDGSYRRICKKYTYSPE